MFPGWFRTLVMAEVACGVAVAVVGVHLALGAPTAGRVIEWARRAPASTPAQPSMPISAPSPAADRLRVAVPGMLSRLNHDTATVAVGEYALILQLESVISDQISRMAVGPAGAG